MSATPKMRRALALLLAGGSLAVGVPAALAAGGDSASSGASQPAVERFVQDEQVQPDREDCPERDGSGGAGSGSEDGATTTPAPSV